MHEVVPVRLVQGIGDVGGVAKHLFGRQRSSGQPIGKRFPVEVLITR